MDRIKYALSRVSHSGAIGEERSFFGRLRALLDNPRNKRIIAGSGAVTLGLASSLVSPSAALAQEPANVNMTPQEGHEQTVDYEAMVGSDELTTQINQAVAESQAITDGVAESTAMPAAETSTNEVAQEVTIPAVDETQTQENEVTTGINEEIDSRVPQVDNGTDTVTESSENEGVVSENPSIVEDNTMNNEQSQETQVDETVDNKQENKGYQVIVQDGSLVVVGDIPEDQLSQVIEDLTNQYGEDVVSNSNVFDHETIDSQINPGQTVNLGDSGYTASKDADGNIVVKDADGNVVYDWTNQNENSQDNQNSQDQTEDNVYKDENGDIHVDIDYNEYFVAQDESGKHHLVVGGVGLSPDQLNDLISDLQAQGKLPEGETPIINALPDEDGLSVTVGDNTYTRVDGEIVITNNNKDNDTGIKDDTIDIDQNEDLENNYEDAHNPDAEPGNKPGVDEPGNPDVTPDPDPENPDVTPDPDPENPDVTPDPEPEKDEPINPSNPSELPQTGVADQAAAALGVAASGVALAGAGAVIDKMRKKGEKDSKKVIYDDLEKLAEEGKTINPHDYEDDLELFAKAWVLSKQQQEVQEPTNVKGRSR